MAETQSGAYTLGELVETSTIDRTCPRLRRGLSRYAPHAEDSMLLGLNGRWLLGSETARERSGRTLRRSSCWEKRFRET
jgi:hypothetical protein